VRGWSEGLRKCRVRHSKLYPQTPEVHPTTPKCTQVDPSPPNILLRTETLTDGICLSIVDRSDQYESDESIGVGFAVG